MILFTILTIIALILLVVTVVALSVFGAATIIVFGDVIVCVVLIGWLIYRLFFKKRK
jgi:hypothetical protein